MKPSAYITDAQWSQMPARRIVRALARGLLYPLALALALQPAVYAAPSPSLLSQLPAFTQSSAHSNVIFLMDDSTSMLSMQLPIPPGITPAAGNPWPFKLNRASPHTSNTHFSPDTSLSTNYPYTREDWILRSPTLNPAYYNPAIRYLPWNNDGVRMPHSGTSVVHEASGYRRGSSGHDPRYKGPNYTSSTPSTLVKNQDSYTGGYGANAGYLDASGNIVRNTPGAAFKAPIPSAYNQDIFTQPMTLTSSSCSAWDTTQIINNYDAPPYCSSGQTAPISEYSKVDCTTGLEIGSWSTTPEDTTCSAANEVGYVIKPPVERKVCPSGTVAFGPSWSPSCCPSGNIVDPAPANVTCTVGASGANACTICTSGTAVSHCPTGLTCPVANRWVIQPTLPVIAHYFRYEGPNDAAGKGDPANYVMVEIERYDNHDADPATALIPSTQLFPIYTTDGDAVLPGNTTIRPDCTATQLGVKACTWAEEAQNFANWYTYYRTRLFAAIAVTAEALSGLTAANGGLDTLRLGYGALNYFNGSRDPYAGSLVAGNPWLFDPATAPSRTVADVDPPGSSTGYVPNEGVITRGVRTFNQGSTARKQVFEWLFSLRTQGATPTREALDSVGRYFSRQDAWGPWSAYPGAVPIQDTRPVTDHESCRRSYTILVSDGEWTNTAGGVQPLLESRGAPPAWVSAQAGSTPLTAASDLTAPVFNDGTHKDAKLDDYKVFPPPAGKTGHLQPQFNTVAGSPTGTLSDVAYYWWSRDLRPDLVNGVRPEVDPAKPEKRNESFWQNVTPYIVGYGLNATMDTSTPLPTTRTSIMNRTSVSWPTVDTTAGKIQDADCSNLDVNGAQSGCGRVNDTFRASRLARGDFLVATDIEDLARKVAGAFATVSEVEGSATTFAGRSTQLVSGDLVYTASFKTNSWTGQVEAFDALALSSAILSGAALPSPVATVQFPAWNSRNVLTSTGFTGAALGLGSLSAADKAAIGGNNVLDWLLGDQSKEVDVGGTLRDRATGALLGDIVNSQPIYSKARDEGYRSARLPLAARLSSGNVDDYSAYVFNKTTNREAAIFVGANDGMLHGFKASDLTEMFAYIPRAVHSKLATLAQPGYLHQYYVDGPVIEGDVVLDATSGDWKSVIVATNGAGPKGIFALDVSQPSSISASNVLWDRVASDVVADDTSDDGRAANEHLGHITQPGVIGSGPDGRWYYFTGNGWESQHDKARLLAIDLKTGAIHAFSADDHGGANPTGDFGTGATTAQPNGLGGVTPVYDSQRNIVALYAGDRHGRLWKFKLSAVYTGGGQAPAHATLDQPWTLQVTPKLLFTAEDASSVRQPISAAPRIVNHPFGGRMIVVGTGRLTETADIGNMQVQSIYGLWEKDPYADTIAIPDRSGLHAFTLSQTGTAASRDRVRSVDLSGYDARTAKGWFLDLAVSGASLGERVIASPVSDFGFVELFSFEPIVGGDRCQGGGASFRYCFDITGNFTRSCIVAGGSTLPANAVGTEILPSVAGATLIKTKYPDATAVTTSPATLTHSGSVRGTTASQACVSRGPSGGTTVTAGALGHTIMNTQTGTGTAAAACDATRVWREIPRR